jgi:hypothetical protein
MIRPIGRPRQITFEVVLLALPINYSRAQRDGFQIVGHHLACLRRNELPIIEPRRVIRLAQWDRCGSRVCENSDVQLACRTSISISSMWESIVLATSFRRRQLRKQFCASFAQARFHTAWVIFGSRTASGQDLLVPRQRTCGGCSAISVSCHFRTHAPQQRTLFDHLVGDSEQRRWYRSSSAREARLLAVAKDSA